MKPGMRPQMGGARGSEPPSGSTDDDEGPKPIGVPAGYTAKVPGKKPKWGVPKNVSQYRASLPQNVPPRYNVGDELRPASWSHERIVDLQSQLVDAGVLDRRKYRRGIWDEYSQDAYSRLLGVANAAGLDYNSALKRYREMASRYGTDDGSDAPVRRPFMGTRIDPERLNNLLDDISVRTIGRRVSPEEKARFSTSFNDSIIAAQRQEYEMSGSGLPGGQGGIVTDPDPQGQGEKFIRENNPAEAQEYDYVQRFKQFQQLLGA